MKLFLIFFSLLIFSCSSDKDKKVDLEIFKKQGEKINVFEVVSTGQDGISIKAVKEKVCGAGAAHRLDHQTAAIHSDGVD